MIRDHMYSIFIQLVGSGERKKNVCHVHPPHPKVTLTSNLTEFNSGYTMQYAQYAVFKDKCFQTNSPIYR